MKKNIKKYEQYNNNNETYGKQSTQWKASKYIYIYNLEPCHSRVSKIFYLVRFLFFEPYQSSKNNIKQLKSIEKQWDMMKMWKKQWTIMKR